MYFPEPSWTDTVQAVAAVGTCIIAAVGFIFVYGQLAQAKRTLNSIAHAAIYSQTQAINELFVAHPDYRDYFYGGRECANDESIRPALLSIADVIIDSFEHILQQRAHLPRGIWPAWVRYMRSIFRTSPLLREQLTLNQEWYDEQLLDLLGIARDARSGA